MTVYNDPDVMFGREKTGGVRISHLSNIDKARSVTIRAPGAGRTQQWRVEPITDDAARTSPTADIASITDLDALRDLWHAAKPGPDRARIEARMHEVKSQGAEVDTVADGFPNEEPA